MRSAPKLSLKKETLVELSTGELSSVVGGTTSDIISRMIQPCVTHDDPVCRAVSVRIRPCPTDC